MLDPNHISTNNIVQAASYIDRIKGVCSEYVLLDLTARQPVFKNIITTTEELMDFSETAFPESFEKIKQLCEELIAEIAQLQLSDQDTEAGHCKVCNGSLGFFKTYHNGSMAEVPLCDDCGKKLIRRISALERPTGVWAM